jgi:hypothetical protein
LYGNKIVYVSGLFLPGGLEKLVLQFNKIVDVSGLSLD